MRLLKDDEVAVKRDTMKEICEIVRDLCGYTEIIKPSEIKNIIQNHMNNETIEYKDLNELCSAFEECTSKLKEISNRIDKLPSFVHDDDYVHTDNNYSNEDRQIILTLVKDIKELKEKLKSTVILDKSVVHTGYYNDSNRTIVIVLSNGDKMEIPAGSLVDIYDGDGETIVMDKRTNTFSISEKVLNKINGLEE